MENINYIDGGEYLSKPNNNNDQQEFRRVRTPKKGEIPGAVEQIMGHGKLKVRCADGNIRMTKVSKGSGEIHTRMWKEILKKQLQVTQEYFNSKI